MLNVKNVAFLLIFFPFILVSSFTLLRQLMYTYMTFTKDDDVVRLVDKECSLMNDSTSLH